MATSNRISVDITDAVKTQFIDLLTQAAALLPAAPTLTPEERQETPTIGPKLQPFDNAAQEVAVQFPQLVPAYQSVVEATKDFNSRAKVSTMQLALDSLREKLGDIDLLMRPARRERCLSPRCMQRRVRTRTRYPRWTRLLAMTRHQPQIWRCCGRR